MFIGGDFAGEEAVPYGLEAGELVACSGRQGSYCIAAPGSTCPWLWYQPDQLPATCPHCLFFPLLWSPGSGPSGDLSSALLSLISDPTWFRPCQPRSNWTVLFPRSCPVLFVLLLWPGSDTGANRSSIDGVLFLTQVSLLNRLFAVGLPSFCR